MRQEVIVIQCLPWYVGIAIFKKDELTLIYIISRVNNIETLYPRRCNVIDGDTVSALHVSLAVLASESSIINQCCRR